MTDNIPESVLKEARRISFEIGKPGDGLSTKAIAIALLRERQRAAECCETFDGPVSDSDFVNGQSTAAQQIRAAILSYDEAQQ